MRRVDIRNVSEVARLLAIPKDGGRGPAQEGDDKLGKYAGVWRLQVLPRSEDVEIPQGDSFQPKIAIEDLAIVFVSQLGESIGRERLRHLRFHTDWGRIIAVRGGGCRHDHPLDVGVTGSEQNVKRAVEIDESGLDGILHGASSGSNRGEVDDVIDSCKERADGFQIANVSLAEVDLAPDRNEILYVAGGEVIENADRSAASNQLFHNVGTDKSCAARDQIECHPPPPL